VQTGRTPFEDYNMIKKHVWDEFVELMSTDEAKAKADKLKEIAKRNKLPHNLGMTGYAFHIEEWRWEEREAAEAGQPTPLMSINEPNVEEVEKKMLEITVAERSGSFQPCREREALTKALGNLKHHSQVRGVSLRQSWKDTFAFDATSHHTRQRYKEGLIEQGREEVI
jgi:hypothetical protein